MFVAYVCFKLICFMVTGLQITDWSLLGQSACVSVFMGKDASSGNKARKLGIWVVFFGEYE